MSNPPGRRAATGIALAALLLLTGCTDSPEDDAAKVREALLANAPGVQDAMVRYRTDVFVNNLDIRLSMPETSEDDDAALTAAIDSTLEQAWSTSTSEPSNISIDIVLAPFAEGDRIGDSSAIRLEGKGLEEALGLERDVHRYMVVVQTRELAERYGEWTGT